MKIVRFSDNGFTPERQTYHLSKNTKFINDNFLKLEYGAWVFLDGFIRVTDLDCLKKISHIWTGDISPKTMVIDAAFNKWLNIADDECKTRGFFLPANSLRNIKYIKKII